MAALDSATASFYLMTGYDDSFVVGVATSVFYIQEDSSVDALAGVVTQTGVFYPADSSFSIGETVKIGQFDSVNSGLSGNISQGATIYGVPVEGGGTVITGKDKQYWY